MKNLHFSTIILSLVLAVLTVASAILIKVGYSGAEKAIEHEIQLTYARDQRTLSTLIAEQFNNIQQISQWLSNNHELQKGLESNDALRITHLMDSLLADSSGQYIDAIVVEDKGGAKTVFSNVSLLGLQLPLKQIVEEHSPLAEWTSTLTEVGGKHYGLLRFSLPVIGERFGEVVGTIHSFVLLNDNFWVLNQLQQLFGSQAASLGTGNIMLDGLESHPGQLQTLRNLTNNAGKAVFSTENSILRTHYLRIGNSDEYMVRSLLPNRSQQLLQDAYSTNLYYATTLVIMLGAAVMLVIRSLISGALHQVTQYAEQVPQNGSPRPFLGGRFPEFIRVGKAVEKMLLRIRERDKHLSSIIDNSPDLIFIRDLQHNFQLFNQRFADMMNIKQVTGEQDQGSLVGDLSAQLFEADLRVLYTHRPIQYKMKIQTNNGFSTFLISKFPIIDDQGKLCSIGGIATDITAIKQAEEQLKLAQQVFSETAEAIIVLDNEQKVLSSNRAFMEMSGFDTGDITTAVDSFLSAHPDILQRLQHDSRWQGEGSLLRLDGSSLPVLVSATLLSSESDATRYVIIFSDITKLKIAEQRIEKERLILRATADMSADLVFFKDLESRFLGCNKQFEKFAGCSEQEILGKTDEQFFELEQAFMCQEQDREVMANNQSYYGEKHLTSNNGERHFIEMRKAPLRDKHGQVQGLIGICRDITEHNLVQKRLKITDTAFENAKESLLVTDQQGSILFVNKALCAASSFSKNELLGTNIKDFASNHHDLIEAALQKGESWQGEIMCTNKNGALYFVWLEVYLVIHEEEGTVNRIYSLTHLNQTKNVDQKIQHLAKYDPLTGLFNRIAMFARLEDAISRAAHNETTMAVILVDINGFKAINDRFGNNAGGAILQEIAGRLKSCVFDKDTVARFGDDEFVIIVDGLANEQDVAVVAQKIAAQFGCKFTIEGFNVELSAAIGIAMCPDDGIDVETLIGSAEKAMQRGKQDISAPYHFYTNELTRYSNQQFALEGELKQALFLNQFELYYRPQYDLNKRQVVAVESVLRWRHPQRGLVNSDSFLSLAENSGLVAPIGLHMLRRAATQAVTWQKQAINFGRIAISISEAQLSQISFIADLQTILLKSKCSSQWLEFEINEIVFSSDSICVHENLVNISKLGIALTVDGFGEERPVLRAMEYLQIQKFKLCKEHSQGFSGNLVNSALIEAVCVLTRSLGIGVVGDCLDNAKQQAFAPPQATNSGQRNFQGKAMSVAEATFYLRCNKNK